MIDDRALERTPPKNKVASLRRAMLLGSTSYCTYTKLNQRTMMNIHRKLGRSAPLAHSTSRKSARALIAMLSLLVATCAQNAIAVKP